MTTDEQGNVTFTKKEHRLVKKYFVEMYRLLTDGPSSIQDYFDSQKEYLELERARCLVVNEPFVREDYV